MPFTMTRTVRALALVSLVFSVTLALYSLAAYTSFLDAYAVFPQVLRTTGTALALAAAVVALVASARARRWRLFGVLLVLAIITAYNPYLPFWIFALIPALNSVSAQTALDVYLLGYTAPCVVTALVILAGAWRNHLVQPALGLVSREAEGLEITSLEA